MRKKALAINKLLMAKAMYRKTTNAKLKHGAKQKKATNIKNRVKTKYNETLTNKNKTLLTL